MTDPKALASEDETEVASDAAVDSPVNPPSDEEVAVTGRDYRLEGNDVSGYIGVDVEYQNYANETEKPLLTDLEKWTYTNQLDHLEGNMDEEKTDETADETPADETPEGKSDESGDQTPSHNPPVSVPGAVITPTV